MSIIHVRQIQSSIENNYGSSIDLSDLDASSEQREDVFLSRGLAALAVKILTDIPVEDSASTVTDGYYDNGIDAVYFHSPERVLYIVQAKWRKQGKGGIDSGEAHKFIKGFQDLVNARFDRFNDKIKAKRQEIESALNDAKTRFVLVIVHSGQQAISPEVNGKFSDLLEEMNDPSEMVTIREIRQSNLHSAIVEGMQGEPIDVDVVIHDWGQRQDPHQAFYGQVAVTDVASWWNQYYPRLFTPNIRMFLGDTEVNETLIDTLTQEPEKFWYFNNGITALCTSIDKKPIGGSSRQTGYFECKDFRIVNGAQTTGAIASAVSKSTGDMANARVPVRIISLENSPEDFEREVTRYNNTQNRIERRDFVALDPEQERIRTELQLEDISYTYKSGELTTGVEDECDLADATVARACANQDSSYAVQAKREIGKLWEDIEKSPYKVLFNSGVSGPEVWRLVQTLRIIEDELKEIEQSVEGRDRLLAVHGNRFISHLVFSHVGEMLAREEVEVSESYKQQVQRQTRETYDRLSSIVNDQYPESYLASLFKNRTKCQNLKESYGEPDH